MKKETYFTTSLIVDAATYVKYKFCPGEITQEQVNQILSQKVVPIFKSLGYLAKLVKNGKKFSRGIKTNMMYNYELNNNIHQQMLACVDDEQLEGSCFVFQNITHR